MIGLIIKDFIQMKRLLKALAGLTILYVLLAFLQGSSELVVTLSVMVCVITGINSVSVDEYSKWNQYALTLPFDRASLVIAKYVMLFIISGISAFAVMLLEVCINKMSGGFLALMAVGGVSFTGSLISMSLMLPFIYKFGIERGRYILMAVIMIPFLAAVLAGKTGVSIEIPAVEDIIQFLDRYPWTIIPLTLVCVIVSMLISVLICKKKEY